LNLFDLILKYTYPWWDYVIWSKFVWILDLGTFFTRFSYKILFVFLFDFFVVLLDFPFSVPNRDWENRDPCKFSHVQWSIFFHSMIIQWNNLNHERGWVKNFPNEFQYFAQILNINIQHSMSLKIYILTDLIIFFRPEISAPFYTLLK